MGLDSSTQFEFGFLVSHPSATFSNGIIMKYQLCAILTEKQNCTFAALDRKLRIRISLGKSVDWISII